MLLRYIYIIFIQDPSDSKSVGKTVIASRLSWLIAIFVFISYRSITHLHDKLDLSYNLFNNPRVTDKLQRVKIRRCLVDDFEPCFVSVWTSGKKEKDNIRWLSRQNNIEPSPEREDFTGNYVLMYYLLARVTKQSAIFSTGIEVVFGCQANSPWLLLLPGNGLTSTFCPDTPRHTPTSRWNLFTARTVNSLKRGASMANMSGTPVPTAALCLEGVSPPPPPSLSSSSKSPRLTLPLTSLNSRVSISHRVWFKSSAMPGSLTASKVNCESDSFEEVVLRFLSVCSRTHFSGTWRFGASSLENISSICLFVWVEWEKETETDGDEWSVEWQRREGEKKTQEVTGSEGQMTK